MKPWSEEIAGRFEEVEVESAALEKNALGDPHVRPLLVYTPPGYELNKARRYPTVYVLQGLTGQLDMWDNRAPFRPTYPEAIDAMFLRREAPPCIVVFVDAWTSLGGSQFLDSTATGRYHTYLCDEVVPFVDGRWRTLPKAAHRGIAGKSSGGYGAMVTPMLRPDLFGGLATHAGDTLFEVSYQPDIREAVRALRDAYQGSYEKFWADFRSRPAFSKKADIVLLNVWCMAACYSADPDGTVRLPFDPATGRTIDEVWARWLAWDPVRLVAKHAAALRGLKAIWIDAGTRDEYYLDLGAEAFRRELEAAGVKGVRYELFDATHAAIEYRYPLALKFLAERLSP